MFPLHRCLPTQATTAYLEAECGSAVALPQALHALLNADLAQVTGRDAPGSASGSRSCAVAFWTSSVDADDMQTALVQITAVSGCCHPC